MIHSEKRTLELDLHRSDHVEFVRLWTSASPRVHAYILTMVMNWADAEDLLQDVGVTVWEKFTEYDRGRDFVAWACGIARNKVLQHKRKVSHSLVDSVELMDRIEKISKSESCSLESQREALRLCLERLSESDLRLLRIHESSGISLKSLAKEAGQSVQALYKSVQRIRARLFDCVTRRLSVWRET